MMAHWPRFCTRIVRYKTFKTSQKSFVKFCESHWFNHGKQNGGRVKQNFDIYPIELFEGDNPGPTTYFTMESQYISSGCSSPTSNMFTATSGDESEAISERKLSNDPECEIENLLEVDIMQASGHMEELDADSLDLLSLPAKVLDKAEELAQKVIQVGWTVVHHHTLPKWLRDNDFLLRGHRPPLNSFCACFQSIFRVHTETGNIWTHLLGFVAFVTITVYFLSRPSLEVQWQEKAVFSAFFFGAVLCLGFSTLFHTVYCHSERVGKFFNKLDYCGIALLTMGSFVPWLYYSFYCRNAPKIIYCAAIFILGTASIVVSMWDFFAEPRFRPLRAGLFIALGLSGVIPAMHFVITDGFWAAIDFAALGWLVLMAALYILGALIYAVRIPERIWPGKFDIWFQSHQIFHVFVVAAAFVHYHGISEIATYRLTFGDCLQE